MKIKLFQCTGWNDLDDLENKVNTWIGGHPEAETVSIRTVVLGSQQGKFVIEVVYRVRSDTDGII